MDAEQIFNEAKQAAIAAVDAEVARKPEDMEAFDCGVAWVVVKPARGAFVNWCKKQGGGRDYGNKWDSGGWCFWKPGSFPGQSIRIHEAGAKAFAEVLVKHGLNAYMDSRLD